MSKIQNEIFEFAYGGGLMDATRQQAFKGPESKLRECEQAKPIVREYIDGILRGENVDFYKTAKTLEECFGAFIEKNGIPGTFSFGNAQKLINMTVKNMFVVTYVKEELRPNFAQCHCPMDQIMIECVIEGFKNRSREDLPEDISEFLGRRGWMGQLRKAWSQIQFDQREQYEIFQKMIRFLAEEEQVSPIEYDYMFWGKTEKVIEG